MGVFNTVIYGKMYSAPLILLSSDNTNLIINDHSFYVDYCHSRIHGERPKCTHLFHVYSNVLCAKHLSHFRVTNIH